MVQGSVILRKNEERRLLAGHQWVFSNEIAAIDGAPENGCLVEILTAHKTLLGVGFYNKNSLIAVRLISRSPINDLQSLMMKRIEKAYELRKTIFPTRTAYRLVHSEADLLPGLIIDRYNDTFVMQLNSAGMENNKSAIVEALQKVCDAKNILTAHDSYLRGLEGLPDENEVLTGNCSTEIISDGVLRFNVDFTKTQKTGFYFDQTENRKLAAQYTKGKRVLDAYCNSGGFGIHALNYGASNVTFLDISSQELTNTRANLGLNKLYDENSVSFINADVFEYLASCQSEGITFDVIMIDPPSFAKSRKSIPIAEKAYEKMHKLSLSILEAGGFLITSSCSHHITEDMYTETVRKAATKCACSVQLLYSVSAAADHPQLPSMPETRYLTFQIYRKV
ncbi:MAG: class I SAM-dependent rRNA methyltransferase [Ignavibacteria bacterium]|nr:class I SAM-dependent rRNA methyltransferase [Ignavibacteria bacterium]